ncbi:MAG TPA: alpha/beta hydrolase-fold protein [Segetibacter sp.]|jgi:predicted alpha/beta superfamily hydrolase
MTKVLFLLFTLMTINAVTAQYTLRIVVNDAAGKDADDWYVAGNFNNWNPRSEVHKLKVFGAKRKAIVLNDFPAGNYQFKFTRGSWEKGETNAEGGDIENREIEVTSDTIIYVRVAGWKDAYPNKPKPNTATAQVKIIDTSFQIPQLNRTRRIWVYLPKGYATSKKSYPVIYMHDGQNLFNEQTAPFGEWGIDEALDTLQTKTKKEAIIVGIDNGGDKRMVEYNPYDNTQFGKGEGDKYVDFLAKTLKPYIDKTLRTRKDSAHTFVAGSSMGGLISLYAVVKYPNIFGGAGVFSPAFWTAPSIYDAVSSTSWKSANKLYFYGGGKEGGLMIPDMEKMIKIVEGKGKSHLRIVKAPLGQHNEATWRKEFPDFYNWIL